MTNPNQTKNVHDVLAMGHLQFRAMFYLGKNLVLLIIDKHD